MKIFRGVSTRRSAGRPSGHKCQLLLTTVLLWTDGTVGICRSPDEKKFLRWRMWMEIAQLQKVKGKSRGSWNVLFVGYDAIFLRDAFY